MLQQLIRQGKVIRNRRAAYGLARNMDLVRGRISAHPDGYGFVVPDEDGDDLFVAPKQMRQVFHGDRVLAAVSGIDRRGRKEGQIVEVIEREHQQIVGRFVAEGGVALRMVRTALGWELPEQPKWSRPRWGTGANLQPAFALDHGL